MLEHEGQEIHLVKDGTRLVKVNVRRVLSGVESEADRREKGSTITQIYIGGDVSSSTIIAGDENQVKPQRSLNMDTSALAISVSSSLAPFFPYIIKGIKLAGQKWFESLGDRAGEEAVTQAITLWDKIKGKSAGNKTIEGAALLLSDDPGNAAVQKMFADALADLMMKDADLAKALADYQKSAPSITIDQRSGGVYFEGSGNISIDGDVAGRDMNKG